MLHACLRNTHATAHAAPIFTDTRSVQLVPVETRQQVQSFMGGFSQTTADAIVLALVVRQRVFADRLAAANDRGFRQVVVLGAGLDTTAFALPPWSNAWRVFEVDHPATQEWKRTQIAALGWTLPPNLVFAPCDFESQDLLSALTAAGFDRTRPAVVGLLGVIDYLTLDATQATFRQLASLAAQSEVTISYNPPPDGTDPIAEEAFKRLAPRVDAAGERFLGYYRQSEIERLAREAGFSDVIHHPLEALNARFFDGRPDHLRLYHLQQLLTAIV
jgi:methyltransferase (TIGR00027 family)